MYTCILYKSHTLLTIDDFWIQLMPSLIPTWYFMRFLFLVTVCWRACRVLPGKCLWCRPMCDNAACYKNTASLADTSSDCRTQKVHYWWLIVINDFDCWLLIAVLHWTKYFFLGIFVVCICRWLICHQGWGHVTKHNEILTLITKSRKIFHNFKRLCI